MAYLDSDKIKVFPSAYRVEETDPTSNLSTEGQLTSLAVAGYDKDTFVKEEGDNLIIYFQGYKFVAKKADIIALFSSSNSNIYVKAKIYGRNTPDVPSELSYSPTLTRGNFSGTDFNPDESGQFKALEFRASSSSGFVQILEKVGGNWQIPASVKLLLRTEAIYNRENDNDFSITDLFRTENLINGDSTCEIREGGTRYAHAEGVGTFAGVEASHAEGENTKAEAYASHAEGEETEAKGEGSHAEGYNTTASEDYSHAEGLGGTASGYASHVEGSNTIASAQHSHAEGEGTQAKGIGSHAEGFGDGDTKGVALGEYSHVEGENNVAEGRASHAEGYGTLSNGIYSHAEGKNNFAEGEGSHTEGEHTHTDGDYSHAEGYNTEALGKYSHAEGYITGAIGKYSHAEGEGTVTNRDASLAIGKYNDYTSGNYVFTVGGGTDGSHRANLLSVDEDGTTKVKEAVLSQQQVSWDAISDNNTLVSKKTVKDHFALYKYSITISARTTYTYAGDDAYMYIEGVIDILSTNGNTNFANIFILSNKIKKLSGDDNTKLYACSGAVTTQVTPSGVLAFNYISKPIIGCYSTNDAGFKIVYRNSMGTLDGVLSEFEIDNTTDLNISVQKQTIFD